MLFTLYKYKTKGPIFNEADLNFDSLKSLHSWVVMNVICPTIYKYFF